MIQKLLFSTLLLALLTPGFGQEKKDLILANGCDTLNYPVPANWGGRNVLTYATNPTGFATGTNSLNDKEVAQFFDQSATTNSFLSRIWIFFGRVDVSAASKVVTIKVYDGTTNAPGGLLGLVSTTLGSLHVDFLLNEQSNFRFIPALALPASKKFFISVDFSALTWDADTLAVNSSIAGRTPALTWVKLSNNQWYNLGGDGLALSLFVHPFVSPTANCESTVPVQMENLQGKSTNFGNELNWQTRSELQNKGFEVQYSADGRSFEPVGWVGSQSVNGSSSAQLSYQFTHRPVQKAEKAWYRLRQMDMNGNSQMSTVLVLNQPPATLVQAMRISPNPAKGGRLQIIWQQPTQPGDYLKLTDLQGKTIRQLAIASHSLQTALQWADVQSGMYYLQLMNKQGVVAAEKCWIE